MMKKHLSSFLFVFTALIMLCGITAYAVDARYAYTNSASSTLTASSGTAYCKSIVNGNSSVTKIEATQYLEKKNNGNWETVSGGTWSTSASSRSLTMSNSKSSLGSGTYRLRTVFIVYSGTKSETVEKTSSEVTL